MEDPRIVENETGTYLLTYTAYDGTTARLLLATGLNTPYCKKHKTPGANPWAIVDRKVRALLPRKISGRYRMYLGNTDLFMASSGDLPNMPWLRNQGILLIYNAMNDDSVGDLPIAKAACCAGQALFDKSDPRACLLSRWRKAS
jgi:predicted GH43/DUF377 family glycosyl hydrolase